MPISGVVPSMGVYFVGQAFITVVMGATAICHQHAQFLDHARHAEPERHPSVQAGVRRRRAVSRHAHSPPVAAAGHHWAHLLMGVTMTASLYWRGVTLVAAIFLAILLFVPVYFDLVEVLQITQYVILAIYTLSRAYIWVLRQHQLRSGRFLRSGRLFFRRVLNQYGADHRAVSNDHRPLFPVR